MGTFNVTVEVAAGPDGPFESLEALVDTGATYTLAPAPLLRRLGVEPIDLITFIIADGSRMQQEIGEATIRLDGRVRTTLVVFGDEGANTLLGAYTLEAFALGVDPRSRQLIPVDGYLVGLRQGNGA